MPRFATPWLSAAALLLVSIGLGTYAWSLRGQIAGLEIRLQDTVARLDRSEQHVAVATRSVATAESRMAVLTAPNMTQVNLQGQPVAPRATGRAFWSRSRGLVFTASDLPPPVTIAVTIESARGVPAPTGDKYRVGLTH